MESPAPADCLPIRIGAFMSKGAMLCGGCGIVHQQEPHPQPNCRFLMLIYMPVMERAAPAMARSMPFIGGPRTPPVEIAHVSMASHPAVQHLMRFLHWN